jgi:hypothetical protein
MNTHELQSTAIRVRHVGRQRRAGWWTLAVALAAWPLGLSLGDSYVAAGIISLGILLLPVGALLLGFAGRDYGSRSGRPGWTRIDEERIELAAGAKRFSLPRRTIIDGWLEEEQDHHTVVLQTRDGTIVSAEFAAERRPDARLLLRLVAADSRAVAFRLTPTGRAGRGCAAGCLAGLVLWAVPPAMLLGLGIVLTLRGEGDSGLTMAMQICGVLIALTALGAWMAFRALPGSTVTVGSDGMRLARSGHRTRFVPYGELDALHFDGKRVRISAGKKIVSVRATSAAANTLIARVQEMSRLSQHSYVLAAGALDRAGRELSEWAQGVRALLEQGGGYRERALDRETLLRVVDDPGGTVEHRIGAAIALAPDATNSESQQMREAAEACAHLGLRTVLAQASRRTTDEREVERALEQV